MWFLNMCFGYGIEWKKSVHILVYDYSFAERQKTWHSLVIQ